MEGVQNVENGVRNLRNLGESIGGCYYDYDNDTAYRSQSGERDMVPEFTCYLFEHLVLQYLIENSTISQVLGQKPTLFLGRSGTGR